MKRQINIRIDEGLLELLRRCARESCISVTEILMVAARLYLGQKDKPLKK